MFRGCLPRLTCPALWSGGQAHAQALATPPPPQPQQLDPENTGFIGADTFTGLVHRHELPLDPAKLDMLVALAQSNERGQVCYQELADLVSVLQAGSGVGLDLARADPGLERGGQVAPPPCPAHPGRGCGHGAEPGTR